MIAGPISTTNSVGKMKRIIGTVSVAGKRPAFSSAFIMRWSRNSRARTRRDWASGVPYFSVCASGLTTPRPDGMSTRRRQHAGADREIWGSEEHTSGLQSHLNFLFRLLLLKKKKI